jgi:AbrB family looped-hinge helix DNA binding protein
VISTEKRTFIKLSPKFQFTIPRAVAVLLKLQAGDIFEVVTENGRIVLRKVTIK